MRLSLTGPKIMVQVPKFCWDKNAMLLYIYILTAIQENNTKIEEVICFYSLASHTCQLRSLY